MTICLSRFYADALIRLKLHLNSRSIQIQLLNFSDRILLFIYASHI